MDDYQRIDLMKLKGKKIVDIRFETSNRTTSLVLTIEGGNKIHANPDELFDKEGMRFDVDSVPWGKFT